MPAERCKCGTDALGGCRLHNAHAARRLQQERDEALAEVQRLREAVACHASTLDEAARRGTVLDRDDLDNAVYNVARAIDPEWWDRRVPGLLPAPTPACKDPDCSVCRASRLTAREGSDG